MPDENPAFLWGIKNEYLQLFAFRHIFLRERENKSKSHLTVPLARTGCQLTHLPPPYGGISPCKRVLMYVCDDAAANLAAGNALP